jgi:hypothetical protein
VGLLLLDRPRDVVEVAVVDLGAVLGGERSTNRTPVRPNHPRVFEPFHRFSSR